MAQGGLVCVGRKASILPPMFDPFSLRPTADVEPPAFHLFNREGKARALLICDHASNALPRGYGTLGIDPDKMFEHIAWDVGAAAVTRHLADALDAPAILGGTSRLFVDLNRYPDDETAVSVFSDGTRITGNEGLSAGEQAHRMSWHRQYHNEVERQVQALAGPTPPPLLFIHSFTPIIRNQRRPWHLGVLHDHNSPESDRLLHVLRRNSDIVVGDNQPYAVNEPRSFSIFHHGIDAGRPYVALEIRQDLIETEAGAEEWAGMLAGAFREMLDPLEVLP